MLVRNIKSNGSFIKNGFTKKRVHLKRLNKTISKKREERGDTSTSAMATHRKRKKRVTHK